ncbi:protein kinase-like protein rad3 [Mollisia scopiformis]|uniref:Serine/threonine-protein kinase MEC1 n=1 Tax=Mollisia scopiformis TaxID=149040 RepID=A0A132BA34_MOLSC|nr:protein kinase-like protein rad3 [Mollisia scopiformis]KUJ09266.1 protein kinase-like protein rad3 [Mollisia scopiformis]
MSFDAPPSTLAAQLVNNLSSKNPPSGGAEDELRQLAQQVSEMENSLVETYDPTVKLEHKHRLIYLLTRSVLERLDHDPFIDVGPFLSQASDALDIFQIAVKEYPAVLDYVLPPGVYFQSRGQEPLWIWLFPRILTLLGRPRYECLTDKIKDFFFSSFQVVSRSPKLWNLNSFFFTYLKECVASTLTLVDILHHLGQAKTIYSRKVEIVLPTTEDDYPMFFSDKDESQSSHVLYCTYKLEDSLASFCQATHLLLMLVDISIEAASSFDATPAFQDYVAWMFTSFCALHDIYQQWQANRSLYEECPNPDSLFFYSLYALISSLKDSLSPTLLRKGYNIVSILCGNILQDQSQIYETSDQLALCACILNLANVCEKHYSMRRSISLQLVPVIKSILEDESALNRLGKDFQSSAMLLCHVCGDKDSETLDLESLKTFESDELSAQFERLDFPDKAAAIPEDGNNQAIEPLKKRRKISELVPVLDEITGNLYELLGSQRVTSIHGLSQLAETCFTALDEANRCKAFEYLGQVPCAASGCLTVTRISGKIQEAKCLVCEGLPVPKNTLLDEIVHNETMKEAISTFSTLVKSAAFSDGKKVRVLAMFALRRFAMHCSDADFIDLEISQLGQWCLSSLKSSTRELRVAAGRTLPAFLRGESTPDSLTRKNRLNTMNVLRPFPDTEPTYLQETCVLAWGQLGRITQDDEFCLVLLALVKYLGHSNSIVSGTAFNEILRLAKSAGMTVERLFSPFWNVVAIEAVTNLLVRPQTSQLMADLLGISVTEFLRLTQSHTLPYLVMSKKVGVIKRISEATNEEIFYLIMRPENLVAVFALLLQQSVTDMEVYIMSLLGFASSEFKRADFHQLLRIGPCEQALHLLKAAAEADDSKRSRIRLGMQFLAEHTIEHTKGKAFNALSSFFDYHILGLVAHLSQVVNDADLKQTVTEKRRSVKAVEELVKMAKAQTRIARPQLCAILQSAFSQEGLQSAAFSAWNAMLRNMEDEDVETMLESTFTTVIQRWDKFDAPTRVKAAAILDYILKERSRLVRNTIVNLPSLSHIPQLKILEEQVQALRTKTDKANAFAIFSRRLGHENSGVVTQALDELKKYLCQNQEFLQTSASSEQPDAVVGQLVRAVLDSCVRFNGLQEKISILAAECLGLIGCLDPNRVESVRAPRSMVVISNFEDPSETTNFVLFTLAEAIVPAFLSTTDTQYQGFLSWVMQELLRGTDFAEVCVDVMRNVRPEAAANDVYQKWLALPQSVQNTLTPFLTSKFILKDIAPTVYEYPIFRPEQPTSSLFSTWLRAFVLDLLQKQSCHNTKILFPPLRRAIRPREVSIANFLLPYLVLYVIIEGTDENRQEIGQDLLNILKYEPPAKLQDNVKLCVEAVFRILDYLAKWTQERQIKASQSRGQDSAELDIAKINSVVEMIPPEIISARALECKSYSRALFYWEQHIRNVKKAGIRPNEDTALLERLQEIYTQIDEPDGIEGISAHLQVVDINQQILGHRKAGRWSAAQSWYEIQLAEKPDDVEVQLNLLTCLRESGQLDVLLNYVDAMFLSKKQAMSKLLGFATEASWATGKWAALEKYVVMHKDLTAENFSVSIGNVLLDLQKEDTAGFNKKLGLLRNRITSSMSRSSTSSFSACHDDMLKLHVLTELEMIAGMDSTPGTNPDRTKLHESLDRRLEVIGSYLSDKQYLLGIRRAAMQLSSPSFNNGEIASTWLTTARLARKGNAVHQSFNAVLHAARLGDESATIEHARLLWKEGQHRKAIQSLQGAIAGNAFMSHNKSIHATSFTNMDSEQQQNLLTARAHLLLAKWLDSAGQTNATALRTQYQLASRTFLHWEKGHYYLGRHYNKLLEAEKDIPFEQQKQTYQTGELSKLIVESYLRSMLYGTKYLHQTLPRVLTLWLDLGNPLKLSGDIRTGPLKEYISNIEIARRKTLDNVHQRWDKYINKLPAYMFYTALPQIVARIAHHNTEVFKFLQLMIAKVIEAYPRQALWSLLAVCSSTQSDRKARGGNILTRLRNSKRAKGSHDMKLLIKNGERLCEQLLMACNAGEFQGNRTIWASLTKDLGFNQRACLPSELAVPVERVLTATLPTLTESTTRHQAFTRDVVTIDSFEDEVMVLSSLQKPRKLTARGSDGKLYRLMCKPKDDLRKDQRLMEFNSMINRSLKRDAESSRRQLYIKTYAVTPLNEECGLIEWVDGLKTLRDILLGLYKTMGIVPNYREIEMYCDEAIKSDDKMPFFTEKVLGTFPPMFHRWFVQQFPEPSAWFAARLRYTRSCAVMSMVGTILGLGDRHGENILFEEGNGGTFHVDFNCLFDKGLTFVRPERVPFRLTHNMIDAMGIYGYEGPFRKSSELTLKLLRQHEETLMTILEAFVYDPTLDLLNKKPDKKKREGSANVPQTAQGVLDSIQRKIRGLLAGESVPLGVEGQVDELIKQATNKVFLAGMYIGWCSFL